MAPKTAHVADDATDDRLSYDEIFNICGNQRRRLALEYLEAHGGSADLSSLAETVAMEETDTPVDRLDRAERKSVYNSLYQTHVPQMAESGVVEYDADETVVSLGERFDEVEPYIGGDDRTAEPRSAHYMGLSVLSGALLAADSFDLLAVPNTTWPAIIMLLFTLLTLTYARRMFTNPLERAAADE